jgi:hypothetical protein
MGVLWKCNNVNMKNPMENYDQSLEILKEDITMLTKTEHM